MFKTRMHTDDPKREPQIIVYRGLMQLKVVFFPFHHLLYLYLPPLELSCSAFVCMVLKAPQGGALMLILAPNISSAVKTVQEFFCGASCSLFDVCELVISHKLRALSQICMQMLVNVFN